MKTRLAKKIGRTTYKFSEYDCNYQPYSIPQQCKAIGVTCKALTAKDREDLRTFFTYRKVPLKYRKIDEIFLPEEFNMR